MSLLCHPHANLAYFIFYPMPVLHPDRRLVLKSLLAASAVFCLPSCTSGTHFDGSFLQLWPSHLDLPKNAWQKRFDVLRQAQCSDLFVQWVGVEDGSNSWQASPSFMEMLFDLAGERGIGLHLGLPYRQNWWAILKTKNWVELETFFAQTLADASRYIEASSLSSHANFQGWYIPYELEQYHWSTVASQEKLIPWLQSLSSIATTAEGLQPAISTYFSQLPTEGSLASLWSNILDHVDLYPMIQDGVGVAGLGNYEALVPLQQLFTTRQISYDLIVELFHQVSNDKKQESFRAIPASPSRVKLQMNRARNFGATRIVAFAIDPWLMDDTPASQQLRDSLLKG